MLVLATAAVADETSDQRQNLVGQRVPEVTISTLSGRKFDPSTLGGQHLIFLFSSRSSKEEGLQWYRTHAKEFVGVTNLTIINVITLDPDAALTPRASIVQRVQRGIQKTQREFRGNLSPEAQEQYDRLPVHWHLDWDGAVTRAFGAPTERIASVLVGPDGRVLRYDDHVSSSSIRRILTTLREASGEGLAGETGAGRGTRTSALLEEIKARRGN